MPSGSYYWFPGYSDPELSRDEKKALGYVVIRLNSGENPQPYYRILLTNENIKLKGFALDRFYFHESTAEKLEDNPLRQYIPEILAEARAQLQQPPVFSDASIIGEVVGANHATALLVLSLVGTASDLDLIAPILHSSSDLNVIYAGCLAAIHCLETTINVYPQQVFPEIVSALRKHLFNEPDLTIHLLTDTESERRVKLALVEEVRKQIRDRFRCYYWNPLDLIDPLLGQAYILLVYSSKTEVLLSCYHQLLTSDEPAAIGIALDQYSYIQKQDTDNPYALYTSETLESARSQLQQSPIVCITADGKTIVGANHASALSVIECLGELEDTPLIKNVLSNSSNSVVVITGCDALRSIFRGQPVAYEEKLFETFSRIMFDESLPISTKYAVLNVIGLDLKPETQMEEWLFSIIYSSLPIKIRVRAALALHHNFTQHEGFYEEFYDRHREEIKAEESLLATVEKETEVTTQPTPPPTDIRSLIITKKQAELNEIETSIAKIDTQIFRLNQRISNLSGRNFNPVTYERSQELKEEKKELIAQKKQLESEKASLESSMKLYQPSDT